MTDEKPEVKLGVVYVGTMDDCKYALSLLERAGYTGTLDVAARLGSQFEVKGYYVVTVPEDQCEAARLAMEVELRKDLDIENIVANNDDTACPACGHAITEESAECPECGLTFM